VKCGVVSESGGREEDAASRIKKANGVFVQLYPVWRNLNISKEVIRIFNTNVKSVLSYAFETWKTTYASAALYPRERSGTHFTGGWVGPRASLDGRKISSPPRFDPGPSSRSKSRK